MMVHRLSETTISESFEFGDKNCKYCSDNQMEYLSNCQIERLYKDFSYKRNELKYLIGRIGEFLCTIHTNGTLAGQVNQHRIDIISSGKRISVKTTAQTNEFITINTHTFEDSMAYLSAIYR